MNHSALKKFASTTRTQLQKQIRQRLEVVLTADTAELRGRQSALKALQDRIQQSSREQVVEEVAYTWFNRLAALRILDARDFHPFRMRVLTPLPEQTLPELLQRARAGVIPPELTGLDRQRFQDLLAGTIPTPQPQAAAYRLLLVAVCNFWHTLMPFLFEPIADETELLLPEDLLSETSVVAGFRLLLSDEDCAQEELIGWLYQYYIAERKDEVMGRKKAVAKEDLPAVTQLFTPHWIVRYLVQNSLGRLWMLNHPDSPLIEQMEYYLPPEPPPAPASPPEAPGQGSLFADTEPSPSGGPADFLQIRSVEDIRFLDPCGGSAHILLYAFDLLHAMYEEEGYAPTEIPSRILQHNLFGLDICPRAVALGAFALMLKARQRSRRFFRDGSRVEPQFHALQDVHFAPGELEGFLQATPLGPLFAGPARDLLEQFRNVEELGSLVTPILPDVSALREAVEAEALADDLFHQKTRDKVRLALKQAELLSPRYHVVTTNPPYLGSKGMNAQLKEFAQAHFPRSKSDLFAMFIERSLQFLLPQGSSALITMQSWMFLSSFEALRSRILNQYTIASMVHLGARAFDSIGGEVVSTTAFVLENAHKPNYRGAYLRLVEGNSEAEKQTLLAQAIAQSKVA
jgi:hypothetical protein